jgi:DNA transformation protein
MDPSFAEFVLEQLGRVAPVTGRRMFGGIGIYSAGHFFALVGDDRLFFKVDDTNRPDFEARGMGPFRPYDGDHTMQYYELPVDVLEDVDELRAWVDKAIAVAVRAKQGKQKGKGKR